MEQTMAVLFQKLVQLYTTEDKNTFIKSYIVNEINKKVENTVTKKEEKRLLIRGDECS
jgi:hypothetical protein